jgi:CheY-like chemotaxis protein
LSSRHSFATTAKDGPLSGKSGTRHPERTDRAGRRILIIEDDPFSLELYTILLEAAGFTMLPAADGEQGLALARRQPPDLIICDVILPKMGGCEVVRHLKSDPVLRQVPVVAVTALDDRGDCERLLAAGFDGYIAKPIEAEVFVEQIEDFYDRVKNPSN